MMTLNRILLFWIASIILWGAILVGCSETTQDQPVSKPTSLVVSSTAPTKIHVPDHVLTKIKTQTAKVTQVPRTISAPGEVSLDLSRVAKVSSRIDGQVEEVFVQLGQHVAKGQPLLAIGSLKLDELVQEFLISKVQMDLRKANFERSKKLLNENVVSERRFMEDRAKFKEARAVHQHVTEKLQNMGLTQSELTDLLQSHSMEGHRYILKAPLTGTISSQTVVLGQGVQPGDQLMELVDVSYVWVFANLPIEQAQQFKNGDHGTIMAKGRPPIGAILSYMAPVADKATLTLRLRFDVANPAGLLKPNEYVEVRLSEETASMLTIPLTAPTLVEGVHGVFIRQTDGFTFLPIELGQEGDGWVEVIKGVQPGDEVVTAGVFDLKNALMKQAIEGD